MERDSLCGADPTGCISGGTAPSLRVLCGMFVRGEGERMGCERWGMLSQQWQGHGGAAWGQWEEMALKDVKHRCYV